MCMGGGSAPKAPAKIPEAPVTPAPAGRGVSDAARKRRATGGSEAGTILTGPRGIEAGAAGSAPGAAKTLLGA